MLRSEEGSWNMAEDDGTISVMEHAFARAKLPTPVSDDMTLGSEAYDMYTHHMLKLGGITVERVGTPAYGDEDEYTTMHILAQIVEEEKLKDMMTIESLENISMCENNEALGLHVKLHNAYAWQVTILANIPERGAAGSSRSSRKRSAAEEGRTVVHSQHMYEIVVGCSATSGEAMRATVALAQVITINMAFKTDRKGVPVVDSDGYPEVCQRRVDVMFTNKHLVTTQVCSGTRCSVFCVLCSATCKLRYGTQHLLCAAVGILRRGLRLGALR